MDGMELGLYISFFNSLILNPHFLGEWNTDVDEHYLLYFNNYVNVNKQERMSE